MEDIHDIRTLIEIIPWWKEYLQYIFVGLGLVIMGSLLYYAFRGKGSQEGSKSVEKQQSAHERVMLALEDAKGYMQPGMDKELAVALTDAVRYYIEAEYDLDAPEKTTEEFLEDAKEHSAFKGVLLQTMIHFLNTCDMAKFAMGEFSAEDQERVHGYAATIVDIIHKEREAERERQRKLEEQRILARKIKQQTRIPFRKS